MPTLQPTSRMLASLGMPSKKRQVNFASRKPVIPEPKRIELLDMKRISFRICAPELHLATFWSVASLPFGN